MNSHPTKEQVDAAKAWANGEECVANYKAMGGTPLEGGDGDGYCSRILAAALASAERDAERFRSHIRRITERHCDCGGAPAGDSGCVACQIYHELNAAVGKEAE